MEPSIEQLATLPARRAAEHPDGRCLDDDRLDLTNADFSQRVDAAAAMLASHGVGVGDVVATVLTNRVELVVAMFAAWKVGAALTPVNPALKASEAAFQLNDSASKVVIYEGTEPQIDDATLVDVEELPASAPEQEGAAADTSTSSPGSSRPTSPPCRPSTPCCPRCPMGSTPTCRRFVSPCAVRPRCPPS